MTRLSSAWTTAGGLRMHDRRTRAEVPGGRPPHVLVHGVAVSSRNMATSLLPDGRLAVLEGAARTFTNTRPGELVGLVLPFLLERSQRAA